MAALDRPLAVLAPGERLVAAVRPHWITLLRPVVVELIAIAGAVATLALLPRHLWPVAAAVALVVAASSLALALAALRRAATWLVVTDRRVLTFSGVIGRRSREIPLWRIDDLASRTGVLGRIVGVGDLVVSSGGDRDGVVLGRIPRPERVQALVAPMLARAGFGGASSGGASPTEELARLADLWARGLLGEEEYATKRAELLRRPW
jgi:membrane protein YdbS with pleckstrin-like domain